MTNAITVNNEKMVRNLKSGQGYWYITINQFDERAIHFKVLKGIRKKIQRFYGTSIDIVIVPKFMMYSTYRKAQKALQDIIDGKLSKDYAMSVVRRVRLPDQFNPEIKKLDDGKVRIDLSAPIHSEFGRFVGHLYYFAQDTLTANNGITRGYPNNGHEHTLVLRGEPIDVFQWLADVVKYYTNKGMVERYKSSLNVLKKLEVSLVEMI